jgi:hypothetical protein
LDFDHLTEKEQRDRGLLKPGDVFVDKVNAVSQIRSEHGMGVESLKCQLICAECHVSETISRMDDSIIREVTPLMREKMDYVNKLKLSGCSCCGYRNDELLRAFDLDHINPLEKINGVSQMIWDSRYSLQNVIDECVECRVLCKFCHRIHTSNQVKEKVAVRNEKVAVMKAGDNVPIS